jgi:hypothetical protein
LLHLVGLDFITLPTLKMDGQTQIKSIFPSREEYKNLGSGIIPFTIFAATHEEPFPIPYDYGISQDGTNACAGRAKK